MRKVERVRPPLHIPPLDLLRVDRGRVHAHYLDDDEGDEAKRLPKCLLAHGSKWWITECRSTAGAALGQRSDAINCPRGSGPLHWRVIHRPPGGVPLHAETRRVV